MWFKIMLVFILSASCLFTGLGMTASAQSESTYSIVDSTSPLYEIADNAYSELDIDSYGATCTSTASGNGVVEITVDQSLEKRGGWFIFQSWDSVDGAVWTKTVSRSSICLVSTKSGLDSGTYRVKSVFKITDKNGKTETVTVYSDERSV